ncbi:MAG: thiosulfate oxidation carrier complex protein SoxZ [Hyphomicrobiaceae bacterium]|nr:thiosulfate oxidation carrier complex protein SoxZ [Hyphomicrobiaceae bacterium]MCC0010148.1 thiosulfate oxidation carrier complex protein SoxZ [Hyphomicrobiaceae bacterium]
MASKPRIKAGKAKAAGDVIEVKTLITHVMETGFRKGKDGKPIPRNIINTFTATFGGKEVFKVDLSSGVSANPYIAFYFKVPGPGDLEMTWVDDAGEKIVEKVPIAVG